MLKFKVRILKNGKGKGVKPMKKTNWTKILNISLLILATLFMCSLIGLGFSKKQIPQVKAELVNGMPFSVGVVTRNANSYSTETNSFNYTSSDVYSGEVRTVEQNEYVMLNNYNTQTKLTSGETITTSLPVENMYISIGEKDKADGVILTGLNITVTLNGQQLNNVGSLKPYVDGGELQNGCYYYAYLDTKDYGEGYYTFSFRYNYTLDGAIYNTNFYDYSFYLIDQNSYASYPTINNAQFGNPFNKKVQYFYNYTTSLLPTYTFDAYHYNVSYVRTKNNETEVVTTSFALNDDTTGTLTINSSTKGISRITVNKTSEEVYNATLTFDELGTYEFLNKYQVKTSSGFNIIENILAYDVSQKNPSTNENDYEAGNLQKGYVRLHIFGVKAYFTKNGKGAELKHENVVSDKTYLLTETLYDRNLLSSNFGFANTILNNPALSADQKAYPTTNLAPIYFDYYGKFNYNGITPVSRYTIYSDENFSNISSSGFLTKDSNLENAGYYELLFEYTYDSFDVTNGSDVLGGNYTQRQAFMFRIDNSDPKVNMFYGDATDNKILPNEAYTNNFVSANWPSTSYFQADITARIFRYNFNGQPLDANGNVSSTPVGVPYTALSRIGEGTAAEANGSYILRIYFTESTNVYIEYNFIIDKDPIQNIKFQAIDAVFTTNSNTPSGFRLVTDKNTVNIDDKVLINQPFTLTYSPKASKAGITTRYYKIPFSATTNTNRQLTWSGRTYIANDYAINPSATSSADYNLNYNSIANNIVDPDNAFNENNSYIYYFEMEDAAGNTASTYIIYDLTTPYIIVDASTKKEGINPIENAYNIVNEQSQVIWGDYKAVAVRTTENETVNNILNHIISSEVNLFPTINGTTYLTSRINKLTFENKSFGKYLTLAENNVVPNIVLYPTAPDNPNAIQSFFSGEASYGYSVTDSSNIPSLTSIAKSNTVTKSIWMNLDNALGITYANYTTSQNDIGEPINPNSTTNSNQLRFTYIPGEGNYAVKSVSYSYYKFSPSDYGEIDNEYLEKFVDNTNNLQPFTGKPASFYPYEKNPSTDFDLGNITISSLKLPNDTERVISDVINPINENNTVVTRPGMYIIRREYNATDEALANSLDTLIRYYYYFVDRTGIISINTGTSAPTDTNIYQDEESGIENKMLYETGSGILFDFGKADGNGHFDTYYTAKQIQQYLAFGNTSLGNFRIFDSNKLSIYFNIPYDKYNSILTLDRADKNLSGNVANNLSRYLQNVSETLAYKFGLKYVVTYKVDSGVDENGNQLITDVSVIDTTDPSNPRYNPSLVSLTSNTTNSLFTFNSAGTYEVTIYDSSDARLNKDTNIANQLNAKINFSFYISHEAPQGNYYSKYNDENQTPMLLQEKSEVLLTDGGAQVYESTYKSTNNKSLSFSFNKTYDKYRAEVDPTNISVTRTVNNVTTTIYSRVNQPVDNDILVENENSYTLTIFDEDSYLQNNKAYIGGSGNNRDYILSQTANITYNIKLQYIGNKEDYNTDAGINYFSKNFVITLDRIKPQFNYNQLIVNDNLKYGAANNTNVDLEKYYFAVNDNFYFRQAESYGFELDSSEIFVRYLESNVANSDFPEYYKTLTPDDENYYLDTMPNNIRFSEAHNAFTKFTYDLTTKSISASEIFTNNGQTRSGYYEIIERDEAQNYKVYTVQYIPSSIEPLEITYEYTPAKLGDGSNTIQGVINKTTNAQAGGIQVLGKELKIIDISSGANGTNDYFYKCDISYNGHVETVYNNPNDRANSTSWTDFINLINSKLEFSNDGSHNGYNITLRFYNRFTDSNGDYILTYNIPGDRLQPIITDNTGGTTFTITIPNDVAGTYIKGFIADKFENGTWTRLTQDAQGSTIITSYSNNTSLKGLRYTFGLGEYRFQLIDNFNRGDLNFDEKSAFYKGLGVNDVNRLQFGISQQYNNLTYTAGNAQLTYQTNLYALKVEQLVDNTYTTISEDNFRENNISELSLVDGVRTLLFENPNKNTELIYRITLLIEKADSSTVYNFSILKVLPDIELRNLSGGKITASSNANEPTIHTENFTINWETNAFNPQVNLTRVYVDNDGKQQTQTINNIANGYQISNVGTYTASITNALGYKDTAKNIYFRLVNGEIVVYDVVAVTPLSERVLQPSKVTSTITVDGVPKILYRYYALSSYNNEPSSGKYIEIRVNKNKGLEYELLSSSTENNKQYKIYGTSNYGYERYIEVVYINEFINGLDENNNIDVGFTNLEVGTPQIVDGQLTGSLVSIPIDKEITSSSDSVVVSWDAAFTGNGDAELLSGNLIFADYYFNGVYARTLSSDNGTKNSLTLKTAGIHSFKFYDLAGNTQLFNGSNTLTINLINDVLFTVNGNNPINNQIYNGEVILEISNRHLYSSDPTITAKLNGKEVSVEKIGTSFYQYRFVNQGYYELTLSTRVSTYNNNEGIEVKTTYCFTIINPLQALPCFNVPQNSNFRIVSVVKDSADITYTLTNLNELWISPASFGTGNYVITLSKYQEETDKTLEFSFNVWINNEIPYIIASIPFGTSTTKNITITYNPKIIYDQIGESYILVTGAKIDINADSPNEVRTYTLTLNQDHYIQIYSKDDKLINSYKVTKNEPLNTTAIIIIVVVSVIVVALIVVFIVIRVHLKFR